jgi:hypothetical protein
LPRESAAFGGLLRELLGDGRIVTEIRQREQLFFVRIGVRVLLGSPCVIRGEKEPRVSYLRVGGPIQGPVLVIGCCTAKPYLDQLRQGLNVAVIGIISVYIRAFLYKAGEKGEFKAQKQEFIQNLKSWKL